MSVYVNRVLNMKKIKAIGFDMDHTIVKYNTENFERLAYESIRERLIRLKNYPEAVASLEFEFKRSIQGLVIDKRRGNLLKLCRFGRVRSAYHGLLRLDYKAQQELYLGRVIDLGDPNMFSLDTSFSLSEGTMFAQLVELKKSGIDIPSHEQIVDDVREMIDLVHRDGTLKNTVRKNIQNYIVQDEKIVQALERLKKYDKKLLIITNSDLNYAELLLEYTINPFLKEHKSWTELFDLTITSSQKPRFFTDNLRFLKIDPQTKLMSSTEGPITHGYFIEGCAKKLQKDLGLSGEEILYLGDHIYGDVVSIKKTFNWRTALVVEPLHEEVLALKKGHKLREEIEEKTDLKQKIEAEINDLYGDEVEHQKKIDKEHRSRLYAKIQKLDTEISELISKYEGLFNPYWGELMRAGQIESRFAGQVEKYACIYMSSVSAFLEESPRTYFRPKRRILAHEL